MLDSLKPKTRAADPAAASAQAAAAKAASDRDASAAADQAAGAAREALAAIEARRVELPLDDAAIARHLDAENVARAKVEIADRLAAGARATLAESAAAARVAARAAMVSQARQMRAAMVERWRREWAAHMPPLIKLIEDAAAVDAACVDANVDQPAGSSYLMPAFALGLASGAGVIVTLEVADLSGEVLARFDERYLPTLDVGENGIA